MIHLSDIEIVSGEGMEGGFSMQIVVDGLWF
jgi:hypothetical protein